MIELLSSPKVLQSGNDLADARWYAARMAQPRHDWYLKEWLKTLGKTQEWVAAKLEVQKSKISRKASGKTPYTREDINALSALLNLQPYELLLHPEDAMEIRNLRKSLRLAAERRTIYRDQDTDQTEQPAQRQTV